jgi:hypothetical protein
LHNPCEEDSSTDDSEVERRNKEEMRDKVSVDSLKNQKLKG